MPALIADTIARHHITTIVMGAWWPGFQGPTLEIERNGTPLPLTTAPAIQAMYANLQDTITALNATGHHVALILSPPVSPRFDPRQMITRSLAGFTINPDALTPARPLDTTDTDRLLTHAATAATILNPVPNICGPTPLCSPVFNRQEPKFADNKHLRPTFVRTHITFLDRILTAE